jgi:hypothetical protein
LKYIFAVRKGGAIAQSVEQWTENPCVPGSIPGGTTSLNRKTRKINVLRVFVLKGVTVLWTFSYYSLFQQLIQQRFHFIRFRAKNIEENEFTVIVGSNN